MAGPLVIKIKNNAKHIIEQEKVIIAYLRVLAVFVFDLFRRPLPYVVHRQHSTGWNRAHIALLRYVPTMTCLPVACSSGSHDRFVRYRSYLRQNPRSESGYDRCASDRNFNSSFPWPCPSAFFVFCSVTISCADSIAATVVSCPFDVAVVADLYRVLSE